MIHTFEIILVLIIVVIALEATAKRIALPSPFLLLPAGICLGFLDHFPRITLDPNLVLYVFLPPLVYAGAAFSSWVEFRQNLRTISALAVGCVLFTTAIVAVAAHWLIPGFEWAAAFVLGAIVSPPDEVAAISIARRLGIPKRLSTILEGEGLVNDATALTVYRVAAVAVVTHSFSMIKTVESFSFTVVGEIIWGLIVGWTLLRIRRFLSNTSLEISLSLLTPFIAYLPAERLGGSGVLATVVTGLYVSYMNSHLVRATTRLQLVPIWTIIEFVFDGLLFLVTGMQLHRILQPLSRTDHHLLWKYGILISLLVIAARLLWALPAIAGLKMSSFVLRRKDPPFHWPSIFIVSWSGMRGAISLAAALSIPLLTRSGLPFPQRDLMIFLTFCVIVSTLILQGLSLPSLIRFFNLDRAGREELAHAGHQEIEARRLAAEASLALLAARRKEGAYPEPLLDRFEDQYRYRNNQFREHLAGDHDGAVQHGTHRFNIQSELIETERSVMLQLRKSGVIDDAILRRVEKDLDLQEMRLRQGISEWNLFADQRDDTAPVEI
jgi:monovalent cation/hydrogen antiporter